MIHIDGIIFSLQSHGGISVYFRELLKRMAAQPLASTVSFETPCKARLEGSTPTGLTVLSRAARPLERYRSCRPTSKRPSVFHSSYYRRPASAGVPTVVTVHDFAYERCVGGLKTRVHSWQKYAAIRQAQAIICISQATRDDLLEFVGLRPEQQLHVIYNGVSSDFQPQDASLSNDEPGSRPFILFVGQRGRYKNFALAACAMEHLPELELHCVGGGPLQTHELDGLSSNCRSRIKHLGFVSDESLNGHYNRAACLLYPSAYEGFGIPVLEAMRAGCPVVSIACKAVTEVGGEALTVADANAQGIAAAVMETLSDGRRAQLASKGLALSQRFSWDLHAEQTLEVYRSLSDNGISTHS